MAIIPPSRPLIGEECLLAGPSQCSVLAAALVHVEMQVSLPQLMTAAEALQARHPILRASIRSRDSLIVYHAPDRKKLDVQIVDGEWENVAQNEWMTPFELEEGFAFRVRWVPGDDGNDCLILCFSHVFVDGRSWISLVNDMLTAVGHLQKEGMNLSVDDLVISLGGFRPGTSLQGRLGINFFLKLGIPLLRGFLFRKEVSKGLDENPLEAISADSTDVSSIPSSIHLFRQINVSEVQSTLTLSKANGVTIGALLFVTCQLAGIRLLLRRGSINLEQIVGKRSLPYFDAQLDFDMRKRVNPPLTSEDVGAFASMATIKTGVLLLDTIWKAASRVKAAIQQAERDGEPHLTAEALTMGIEKIKDLFWKGVEQSRSHSLLGGVVGAISNISSLGRYPYSTSFPVGLSLRCIHGGNSQCRFGPAWTFFITTVGEVMTWDLTFSPNVLNKEDAEFLLDEAKQIFVGVSDGDGDTIADLLKR